MSADFIADRVRRIRVSPSTAAANRARELREAGVDLIDLTVGEPDFDTPAHIKAAAVAAIEAGETRYTAVNGTPRLREAVIDRLRERTGVAYGQDQIAVGGGAKQIIFLALTATLNAGDEVVVPAPYWVSYPDMVLANDGTPVVVPAAAGNDFKITAGQLRGALTDRTKWLILNAPGNPSGAVYTEAELRDLAAVLRDHPRVRVLTDEIYDEIAFGADPPVSLVRAAPALRDRVLLVNGVSKAYAMTGWRLGYAAGPPDLIGAINKLQSQTSSCPSSISQAAAAAALTGDQSFVAEAREVYRARRDLAVAGFAGIDGLSCTSPAGAFYLLVGCGGAIGRKTPAGDPIDTDEDFALYLLEQARVAVIQGSAYGVSPYFRISFATSEATLRTAVTAVAKATQALH